jgi:hypothetical protein
MVDVNLNGIDYSFSFDKHGTTLQHEDKSLNTYVNLTSKAAGYAGYCTNPMKQCPILK